MAKIVMIVDDEPDIGFSVKQYLEKSGDGYVVICVDSGRQCLDLLNKGQIPDLILLDIMMPEMSGWYVFERIKGHESWRNISIVFLTARVDMVARNAGNFLGDDYIEKPFEIKDLKKRIDKVLKEKKNHM